MLNAGCATSDTQERRDFIKSRPHGFFELTVEDNSIIDITLEKEGQKKFVKPDKCRINVLANSELRLSSSVFPHGTAAPYSVSSGFRFPISVGSYDIEIIYNGCHFANGSESRNYILGITVAEGLVYQSTLRGNGVSQISEGLNETVTLEKIYELIDNK